MKVAKIAKYSAISFVVLLCEMTFSKHIEVCGAVPMFTFSFLMAAVIFEDDVKYILVLSALLGGIIDVSLSYGFGTYAVTFMLSSLVAFFIRDKLFSSKILLLICNTFFLSVFTEIVFYILHITDIGGRFWILFTSIIVPTGIYNIFISLIFYPVLKRILLTRR